MNSTASLVSVSSAVAAVITAMEPTRMNLLYLQPLPWCMEHLLPNRLQGMQDYLHRYICDYCCRTWNNRHRVDNHLDAICSRSQSRSNTHFQTPSPRRNCLSRIQSDLNFPFVLKLPQLLMALGLALGLALVWTLVGWALLPVVLTLVG